MVEVMIGHSVDLLRFCFVWHSVFNNEERITLLWQHSKVFN